jgi:hypothetical protein
MKRPITVALCFVLLLVSIILVSHSATPAHAQEKSCTVPKAFGTMRGVGAALLFLEAPDGTIRGINPDSNCRVEYTIQRR